jgi:hypothetical protein
MKFATAKEHRDFFQKQGWIEFEGLLSDSQLISVNQAIDQVLAERLNVSSDQVHLTSPEKLYLQGHDLWRSHSILHKFVAQARFAEIIGELIEKKPLRLGCDQFFPFFYPGPFSKEQGSVYSHFLNQTTSLEAVSCMQGVICGLLLALNEKEEFSSSEERGMEGIDIFPRKAGNVIFFQPTIPINWSHLCKHVGQRFYLIIYTSVIAHYRLQPQDPHTHALKRLGYVFNDKLSDKLNPIIYTPGR